MAAVRVAVIDDFQRAAETSPDWTALGNDAEVSFFHDHVDDPQLLVNRLRPYDVVVAMRERTPFPGDVLQALPTLRLLVATGMHHQTIDFDAATAAGITVCGTQSTDGVAHDYYIRQLADMKGSARVDRMDADDLAQYGRLCGWTLARAHARSGDRIAIDAYLGRSASFDRAIAAFSTTYADQNERDFAALSAAASDGRIEVALG